MLLLSLLALFVLLPDIDRTIRLGNEDTSVNNGLFLTPEALIGLLLWGFLWAVFLPTGVLAWREPDALDPETVTRARGISEPLRDALLGSGLAVGTGAALVSDSGFWVLLALVLVLMALGAVARRASGQPAISPATKGGLGAAFLILGALVTLTVAGPTLLHSVVILLSLAAGVTLIGLAFRGG